LQRLVFETAAAREDISLDEYIEKYRKEYEGVYLAEDGEDTLTLDMVMEEMTADALMKIAADEEGLRELVGMLTEKQPTLLERIKAYIEKLLETLEGLLTDGRFADFSEDIAKDIESTRRLRAAFADALKKAGQRTEEEKNNNENITKFSLKGSFAEQVDAVLDETKDFAHSHVYVMDTPKVLTDLGLRKLPMLMTAKHVYTTVKDSGKYKKVNYHGLGANLLKQIPSAMEKPVAIMESATKNDSVVMVLELVDKEGRPIIAAIKMNGYGNYEEVEIETNVITSVYGRQGFYHFMDRAIREKRMLYFDKEKSQLLKETPGVQFPDNLNEANFTDSIARFQEKNNNKNITKFSLKQPMEETKDLIAIHNISEGNLKRTLELGGFPMPSIAITREEMKHSKFGEISIIFPKDTIDPADKRNKVFSADAWTPTFPRIEYEVDEKSREALRKRVNKLEIPDYYKGRVMGVISSLEDSLRINGGEAGLIEDVIENRSLQAAYLAEQGRKIEIEQREKKGEPDF